ncbi:MAG TPA: alpha-amylase family glycosyl hydrolase [bacterium]|nr:alpha-amylase family glycosyl hydrolase [bacterium]
MNRPPSWLENALFYQVYPQSYYDSNGDGIGDLPGLTRKLDYIRSMGFNALWINPCFVSPFQDAGYDVADFYRIAPRYGTNADAKRLFAEARKRGIRVCLDLVPGHTSIDHPWFRMASRAGRNRYSDRYVWADGHSEIHEPGLNLIRGLAERSVGYAANYYYSQPSLNYGFAHPDPKKPWQQGVDHPGPKATAAEMLRIMLFWMKLGASGFRVDMAGSLVKGDPDGQATIRLWRKLSGALKRRYPEAFLISEWSDPSRAIQAGFDADFLLHFGPHAGAYLSLFRDGKKSFFHSSGQGDITLFLKTFQHLTKEAGSRGYVCVPSGNHDFSRISRYLGPKELKTSFAFLLTLPGVPFVYYGDEIGMSYLEKTPTKEGGYERTGTRTPMQWDKGRNKGFSTARPTKLYLPVDPSPKAPDVASQEKDPSSLLATVRALAALRHAHPALQAKGSFQVLSKGRHQPLAYLRERDGQKLLVVIQPGRQKARFQLSRGAWPLPLLTQGARIHRGAIELAGTSFGIFQL